MKPPRRLLLRVIVYFEERLRGFPSKELFYRREISKPRGLRRYLLGFLAQTSASLLVLYDRAFPSESWGWRQHEDLATTKWWLYLTSPLYREIYSIVEIQPDENDYATVPLLYVEELGLGIVASNGGLDFFGTTSDHNDWLYPLVSLHGGSIGWKDALCVLQMRRHTLLTSSDLPTRTLGQIIYKHYTKARNKKMRVVS